MSFARVRALSIVGALVVCAVVLSVVAVTRDRQARTSYGHSCPPGAVPVTTRPLPDESAIKLNVLNGTNRAGLAAEVADKFRNRKFTVDKVGDTQKYAGDAPAMLRYGPKTFAAATVVNAYFLNRADLKFDVKNADDHITVIIGPSYTTLGTPTDVHQAIAAEGNPSPPAGTCDASLG